MPAALNPESPLPLYHQLADRLLEGIRTGEYRSGSRIPSETALAGTLASFERGGVPVRTSLVQRTRRLHVEPDAENPFAGREAWFFSRLSRVEGDPVLLEDLYLEIDCFPGLDRQSLAGRSLSQLADEQYHLRPESADQNFRVVRAGTRRGEQLGCSRQTPILLVKRTLHFPAMRSAIFAELACRTDRLAFSQTLRDPSHA